MKTIGIVSALLALCGFVARPATGESARLFKTRLSQPVQGLQFSAQIAADPVGSDGRIPVEISVRNVGSDPIAAPLSWSYGSGSFIPYIKVEGKGHGCYPLYASEPPPPAAWLYTVFHPGAEISRFMVLDARYFPKGKHQLFFGVTVDSRIDTNEWTATEVNRIADFVWHGKALEPLGPLPLDLTSCTNCGTGDSVALLKGVSDKVIYSDMRHPLPSRSYMAKDLPVVFSGLRVFRPALMLSAELGLIPFDKRQA